MSKQGIKSGVAKAPPTIVNRVVFGGAVARAGIGIKQLVNGIKWNQDHSGHCGRVVTFTKSNYGLVN